MICRVLPLSIALGAVALADTAPKWNDTAAVGIGDDRIVLPVSQSLTPAGKTTELPGMRPVTVALSPDGRLLATAGKTSALVILDLANPGKPRHIPFPNEKAVPDPLKTNDLKPDRSGQISYTGLVFAPDGKRLYLSNVNGSIKIFTVGDDAAVTASGTWPLPGKAAPGRSAEIPAGLAVSPDGSRLYVCGSLSNNLHELDTATGKVVRSIPVGMIPYQVVLTGHTVFVSNRAGRRPVDGDQVETAGRGVNVRVTGPLSMVAPGTVSAIDLGSGTSLAEIEVGRQPGAMALAPDRRHLVVANADDDTLSVVDTETRKVVSTPTVRWRIDDPFGASPTALTFTPDGKKLLVCLGTQNTLATFDFTPAKTTLRGMIPTAWFPSGVVLDANRNTLHVSNMKGLGSGAHLIRVGKDARTRAYFGSLSHIPVPKPDELEELTEQTLDNYRADVVRQALLPARPERKPVPVPERSGEPSVFEHVIYLIRENRTYDQVLGDMPEGRGKKDLCIFGEKITPNIHKLSRDFVLLDNTYCSGILSADGHNWSLSAFANDYLERSFAGFPRAYPDGLGPNDLDVLAWSPQGFLWSAAKKARRTTRVYGEMCTGTTKFSDPNTPGRPRFVDFHQDHVNGTKVGTFTVKPGHASVIEHLATDYPAWADTIPDQIRADIFIGHMQACERGEKKFENLHILSLPNDHTSGTKKGLPTPAAAVADNDLALGRIIEAVSKSKFWKNTCVISIEDDPQAGWDHVSGFRTVCIVASPYTKRGEVVSTHFNQPGLIRTIGLMLGFPPLNQMDAGSTPFRDCFTDTPDFSPYLATPNRIKLDTINGAPSSHTHPKMREIAEASAQLPLDTLDACDEDELNRILWHAMKGPDAEYPLWAVVPPELRGEDDDDEEEID